MFLLSFAGADFRHWTDENLIWNGLKENLDNCLESSEFVFKHFPTRMKNYVNNRMCTSLPNCFKQISPAGIEAYRDRQTKNTSMLYGE